ncbi:MAG: single-stranded DNA-binding protein [Bacteroidales bacterium]|nr:single-stranded DNA-binding protein [Bacteroidales bacterium]
MQSFNRIHLRGTVGSVDCSNIQGHCRVLFSLVTNYAYSSPVGDAMIDITWFNVLLRLKPGDERIQQIQKGSIVEVEGRVRMLKVVSEDGEHKDYQVVAKSFKVLSEESIAPESTGGEALASLRSQ